MKFVDPYKAPEYNYQYKRRWKDTKHLIAMNGGIYNPVLVIGRKSEFEDSLSRHYDIKFRYTCFDLNYQFPILSKYNTVLCFQVIEHLLNPLLFMQEIWKLMNKDSLLYISYPIQPKYFWSSGHFHEYDKSRFHYLIKESGFEIIGYKEKIMWRRIKGVRSIIRNTPLGWCKHQYYCLKGLK